MQINSIQNSNPSKHPSFGDRIPLIKEMTDAQKTVYNTVIKPVLYCDDFAEFSQKLHSKGIDVVVKPDAMPDFVKIILLKATEVVDPLLKVVKDKEGKAIVERFGPESLTTMTAGKFKMFLDRGTQFMYGHAFEKSNLPGVHVPCSLADKHAIRNALEDDMGPVF